MKSATKRALFSRPLITLSQKIARPHWLSLQHIQEKVQKSFESPSVLTSPSYQSSTNETKHEMAIYS
jgi:hypothetical protein